MSLTKDQRNALPESDFAVPGKRKLPMHDATHVRLAHDMVERTQDLTSEERAEARRRILHKAKELGVDTTEWEVSASVSFEAMAIEMPVVNGHPNRMPFKGVLTRLDQPSDKAPGGSGGHRVLMSTAIAERALPSLLGMAVDFKPGFEGHNPQQKIGLITAAEIVADAIEIEGFFYAKDFPEECAQIRTEKSNLGFSFEVDARIQDSDADLWVIDKCVFTGAAVLYKDLAAYTTTSLAAQAEGINMNPEELKALLAEAVAPLSAQITAQVAELAAMKELQAKGASLAGPIIDQVKPFVDRLNACAADMEAAGVGVHAENGHAKHLRHMAAHMAAEAVSGRVPHVYRDHDFLTNSVISAAAKPDAATTAALAAVTSAVADLGTKFTDLQAKAFTAAPAPQRQTIGGDVKTLLAKAGLESAVAEGKKLTMTQVDAALDAAGMKDTRARLTAKLKLRENGLMEVAQAN